jgi:hypothetical protein
LQTVVGVENISRVMDFDPSTLYAKTPLLPSEKLKVTVPTAVTVK